MMGSVVIQLYAGECTPNVDWALSGMTEPVAIKARNECLVVCLKQKGNAEHWTKAWHSTPTVHPYQQKTNFHNYEIMKKTSLAKSIF